ncbi:hypothetical protein HK103_005180 [Boothiomyces macroporosus]|uniref:Uncharacterized protein n=1 Tax=Boothiomyces macroporosus TaxID=261099 RepID=A0AAD5Y7X3_9FUNG|nr:hypothetical protein HK103_005180 [Boothiomyces macroporosus]
MPENIENSCIKSDFAYKEYYADIQQIFSEDLPSKRKYTSDFKFYRNVGEGNIKMKKFKELPSLPVRESISPLVDFTAPYTDNPFISTGQNTMNQSAFLPLTLQDAICNEPLFGSDQITPLAPPDDSIDNYLAAMFAPLPSTPLQFTENIQGLLTPNSVPLPTFDISNLFQTPKQNVASNDTTLWTDSNDFFAELVADTSSNNVETKPNDKLGQDELAFWNSSFPVHPTFPLSPPSSITEDLKPTYPKVRTSKRKYKQQPPNSSTKLKPITRFVRFWKPLWKERFPEKSPRYVFSRIMAMLQKEQANDPHYLSSWEQGPPANMDVSKYIAKYM